MYVLIIVCVVSLKLVRKAVAMELLISFLYHVVL